MNGSLGWNTEASCYEAVYGAVIAATPARAVAPLRRDRTRGAAEDGGGNHRTQTGLWSSSLSVEEFRRPSLDRASN